MGTGPKLKSNAKVNAIRDNPKAAHAGTLWVCQKRGLGVVTEGCGVGGRGCGLVTVVGCLTGSLTGVAGLGWIVGCGVVDGGIPGLVLTGVIVMEDRGGAGNFSANVSKPVIWFNEF
jgi:hypothetical protein